MAKTLGAFKKDFFIILIAFLGLLIFIPFYTYVVFAKDLGSKESIMNRNNTGVVLTDRNGNEFASFYEAKRKEFIPIDTLPPHVSQAIIAIEDKDFYEHPGFSIPAIARSLYKDIVKKELAYGGSTITQQLVKNALLSSRKSFVRKIQEIVLAQEIERRYSKQQILEMYVNSVYFGEGAFGIESAAEAYFGKGAKDLTVAESAMLAGLLTAPSTYSPVNGNGQAATARQQIVVQKMYEQGYITAEERDQALTQELVYTQRKNDLNTKAIHFAIMVRQQLIDKYGEEVISRSGYKVKTSLDMDWQTYAEGVVKQQVANLASNNVSNGAAVVMDPHTGEILVLVGSKDWYDNQYGKVNMAITPRQPGSSFKPIVYLKALEDGIITPATTLKDEPKTFINDDNPGCTQNCEYKPQNYDRRFRGNVTVRRALANSLNVPAVEVMEKVGISEALDMAKRLGINSLKDPSNYGLSLVLGTGEVKLVEITNAFGVFATEGIENKPTAILEITNKYGENIYTHEPENAEVVDPKYTFLISSILSDNSARAEVFGSALTISRPAAVKTGTTEDYRDALTIGYTPQLVVGVWVGNNDNQAMDRIAGSLGAAPIWRQLMEQFHQGKPVARFTPPFGIVSCSSFVTRDASVSARMEYFADGTEPSRGRCTDVDGALVRDNLPTTQPSITPTPSTEAPTPQPTSTPEPSPTPQIGSPGEITIPEEQQESIRIEIQEIRREEKEARKREKKESYVYFPYFS